MQEFFGESFEQMYRTAIEAAVKSKKLPQKVNVPEYTQEVLEKVLLTINELVLEGESHETIVEKAKQLLPAEVSMKKVPTVEIPIALEFPEVLREDPETQAKVLKIHRAIGIASLATLSAKAGYNWQRELANMANEKALGLGGSQVEDAEFDDEEEKDEEEKGEKKKGEES